MLDYSDFNRCRACPNRGGAHGCTAYGGEGIDPLSAVARCIADRPGDQVAGFPAGLFMIDRGRFQAFVEGRHLLANADGSQPSKEYLAGFKYGALAHRLYLRESGGSEGGGGEKSLSQAVETRGTED